MNIEGPNGELFEMNSRSDLVQYIYALQDDVKGNPKGWENADLHTYLGALAAFLNDAHGYYRNAKLDVNADEPSWLLFADCLVAAAAYD